ncbi:phage tail protein [Celerinatantimonas sp. MCCC 1A17872]|uniref:phage tail protein n=1 Tax=Celerinatantimonas sp. MCCC 1A17872 TaxID=3177514 RepID=UPI0038C1C4B9
MMMAYGNFVFSLTTLAYQELRRQTQWRFGKTERVGTNPARQFIGKGDDTIRLTGTLLPTFKGSATSLDALRMMGNTGKAYPLVEGAGRVYGIFILESMEESKSIFIDNGSARHIEFNLALQRIDDDRTDLLGDVTQGSQLLPLVTN